MGSAAQYFEVEAPVEQLYAYWRDFSHFPAFMPDVEEVTVTGPTTSHWKVTGPLGKSVEWDAEIVEDLPNQRIAWRSVGDSQVDNAGAVRFDDRGGRTNIEVSLEYNPPAGKAGELVAEHCRGSAGHAAGRRPGWGALDDVGAASKLPVPGRPATGHSSFVGGRGQARLVRVVSLGSCSDLSWSATAAPEIPTRLASSWAAKATPKNSAIPVRLAHSNSAMTPVRGP